MFFKKKIVSSILAASLLVSGVSFIPGAIAEEIGDPEPLLLTTTSAPLPPNPVPSVVIEKMDAVRALIPPQDIAQINEAITKLNNLSDSSIIKWSIWPEIEEKLSSVSNPSDYNLITPESMLALMKKAALMTYADHSGIESLRVDPELRPVMEQLEKLGSDDPSKPVDIIPEDFVDFFYAVESKVIFNALDRLEANSFKTMIRESMIEVMEEDQLALAKLYNNIGIKYEKLLNLKDRFHNAVDPEWKAYKAVAFGYARDGLYVQNEYFTTSRYVDPYFEIYANSMPNSLEYYKWSKVSGDPDVSISQTGTITLPAVRKDGGVYKGVFALDVYYTEKAGEVSKRLFSEPMSIIYNSEFNDDVQTYVNQFESLLNKVNRAKSKIKKTEAKRDLQNAFNKAIQNLATFKMKPTVNKNKITIDEKLLLSRAGYVIQNINDLLAELKGKVEYNRLNSKIILDLGTVNLNDLDLVISKKLADALKKANIKTLSVSLNGITAHIPVSQITSDITLELTKQNTTNYLKNKSKAVKKNVGTYSKHLKSNFYTLKVTSSNKKAKFEIPVQLNIPVPLKVDGNTLQYSNVVNGKKVIMPAVLRKGKLVRQIRLSNNESTTYALTKPTWKYSDEKIFPSWSKRGIAVLTSKGVLGPKQKLQYRPNDGISKGLFLKQLITSLGLTDEKAKVTFRDVKTNNPNYKYIATAVKLGIVKGKSKTVFAPNETISREQMALMVAKVLQVKEKRKVVDKPLNTLKKFKDYKQISKTAQEPIASLVNLDIMNGQKGFMNPDGIATRAHVAKVLHETFKYYYK